MSKITDDMMAAIKYKQPFSRGNVVVKHTDNRVFVTLHGHHIAVFRLDTNVLKVSWCGHPTNQTTNTLRPIIQYFLGAGLEADAVRVQCIKGTPTITVGKHKHKLNDYARILIECDQHHIIELTQSPHDPVTEAF